MESPPAAVRLLAAGVLGRGLRAGERELLHVADLAEERHHASAARSADRCETTACTVRNVPSESTMITGCWAAAKSPTTGITLITNGVCVVIGHERLLAVEQRHLRGLQHVAAAVALGGVDQEEGFDVAEDGEAEVRHVHRLAELRRGQVEAVLPEGNVEVGREVGERMVPAGRLLQTDDFLACLPARASRIVGGAACRRC